MRSEFVRIYKAVHTWTGILSGMALFIAFYAGAITLFKEQLVAWATPPDAAAVRAQAVPLSEAPALIAGTLARHPEVARLFDIHVHRSDANPDLMAWRTSDGDEHDVLSGRRFVATLASDGSVGAEEVQRSLLAEFIDVLHRVVGLPVDSDLNRYVMGAIATLYFLALFSGLVVLLPSLVKDLFALRVGPNLKRMWLDAHNVVGLGSFPFHVAMSLTAAVFAFHDAIFLVQNQVIHDGKLGAVFSSGFGASDPAPPDPSALLPPAEIISRVTEVAPTFEPTMLRYLRAKGPNPTVFVFGHDSRRLEQRSLGGMAIVDPYSGRIVTTAYLPGHQSGAETLLASLFAMHFASYGGMPVKWTYFALGLLGAWLVYSGNLLWIESRRRSARKLAAGAVPAQRRDTRIMAAASIGVCLGAVCGISLTIACAKWLHGHVADLNTWHRGVYYAAFFAAIGWSFYRGGARASVDLLRVAAATTLVIPLTTLLAAAFPALGMWSHGTAAALAVDATALLIGLAFVWLARATARRVYEGPRDSVWSAHAPIGSGAEAPDASAAEPR